MRSTRSVTATPSSHRSQGVLEKDACTVGRRRPDLADSTITTHRRRLDRELDRLLDLKPTDVEGSHLRATIAVTATDKLLMFLTRRDVAATNNESERALRPSVIFRKVTNGFRSEWAPRFTLTSAPLSQPAASPAAPLSQPSATLSQLPCPSESQPDQRDRGDSLVFSTPRQPGVEFANGKHCGRGQARRNGDCDPLRGTTAVRCQLSLRVHDRRGQFR
jgi:hypothetical protein